MTIRSRLYLTFICLAAAAIFLLTNWIIGDIRPRYLATMEETMVDTATILASLLTENLQNGEIDTALIQSAFDRAGERALCAQIYELTKTDMNMRVYVTNSRGVVIFDSDNNRDLGRDYSQWNDVMKTLRGEYGARSTDLDPDDPRSSILYVATPLLARGHLLGSLTVAKPAGSIDLFLYNARQQIILAGVLAGAALIVLGIAVSRWITQPIERLTRYANAVRDGRRVKPEGLGSSEIRDLGQAFEEMRDALEGKAYVEKYIQTLTHEMKSPLSAIQGAAELLQEPMQETDRQRFLMNIQSETRRMRALIDRLLQLSAVESRKTIKDIERIDLGNILVQLVRSFEPRYSGIPFKLQISDHLPLVNGELFLIRQAIENILQNALDFSPPASPVEISITSDGDRVHLIVRDHGPGIPEYALGRIFERFYSLERPGSGRKSSGLGLGFVREVMELHHGRVQIENMPDTGVSASLIFPAAG